MRRVNRATLLFSDRSPGRYAFNVLAGALRGVATQDELRLEFARTPRSLATTLEQALERGDRTVVAWSFYSPSFAECADELADLRALFPSGWTALAGGVHATAEPLATLRAGFDFAALGEGEHTVRELARVLAEGGALREVRGLARLESGALVRNARGAPVDELDTFAPFDPARRRFGAIEITRGCIYACKFCQTPFLSKARFRHRSSSNVAHWAAEIARAGLRDVRFISPTSLSYGSRDEQVELAAVEELLARVREAIGAQGRLFFGTFPSEVRPEHVTPQALAVLRRYVDNDNLVIGGQSGSERVLEATHRGHDVESIERAVRVSLAAGFKPNVDFLLGLPGEDERDALATLELVERLTQLGARAHAHTFMPLPGTPLRKAAPGRVAGAQRARLESLEGAGKLFGQWRRHEQLAGELAAQRTASSSSANPG
ncbi:MAG: TIGR04013 family B12-binding domain/radical SAM domain-containing protein [Planctomycetes bacterium]|nr:TIGR04013 family B12-binding domain/radical SAM domain-containing protein [Planctomycetota bacterium]